VVVVPDWPVAGGVVVPDVPDCVSVVPVEPVVPVCVSVVPVDEPLVELSCFWSQAASDSAPTIARAAKTDFIIVVIP
jgi:hypothetical protein